MKKYIRPTVPATPAPFKHDDLYHRLLNVSNHHRHQGTRDHAGILLSQYNTAGGPELMKKEIENFLNQLASFETNLKKI